MSIIPPLPFTLVDGTLADASQVMANFLAVLGAVNTNAQPANTSGPTYAGAVAYSNTNGGAGVSIPNGFGTNLIDFEHTVIDTASIHTANTDFTVPAGVTKVRIIARAIVSCEVSAIHASGTINLQLFKSGTVMPFQCTTTNSPQGTSPVSFVFSSLSIISPVILVSSGDVFQLNIEQITGNAMTLLTSNDAGPYFEMQILG